MWSEFESKCGKKWKNIIKKKERKGGIGKSKIELEKRKLRE